MCRRNERITIRRALTGAAALAALALALGPALPARAQDEAGEGLEQFLADHDLDALLATHLREELERHSGDDRTEIAVRLAAVYARLLESAPSAREQEMWEQRSIALLRETPAADSTELRLSLARASYVRTERIVEQYRLRLADAAEVETASRSFLELAQTFSEIAVRADRDVDHFERQEESGRDFDEELVSIALAQARRYRSLGHYFAGWSYYHAAALSGNEKPAIDAMREFGWLLNATPGDFPSLERLPEQFLRYEHVARATIGVAGCLSLRGSDNQAVAWLEAIDNAEEVAPEVSDQLRLFRIEIYARARRWYELSQLIDASREIDAEGDILPLPILDARLLAVAVFEADFRKEAEPVIERLREVALADLVARGELGHVLDLARRYGTASLATSGFIVQHVRGLLSYEEARIRHRALDTDENEPTADVETVQLYLAAAEALRNATRAIDYDRYPTAHGNNVMLLALSLYYSSAGVSSDPKQLFQAAEYFVQAAELVDDQGRAANAMWMGIRCLDLLVDRSTGDTGVYTARRNELIELFLSRYPSNDRAAALVLKQSTSKIENTEAAISDLLSIPPESSVYETARRHAARLLYDEFRNASAADRDWSARRYIEIAEPLLILDHRRAQAGDVDALSLAVVRSRRLLDAMIATTPPEIDRADRTLDVLLSLMASGMLDDPAVEAEAGYRRAQILLARGDVAAARAAVDQIQQGDPRYAAAGNRAIYGYASRAWREAPDAQTARLVYQYGLRLIGLYQKEREDPLADAAITTLHATVADAAAWLWRQARDESARDLATRLYDALLQRYPRNTPFLRGAALHAEASGADPLAVEHWRTLASGLEENTDAWFEARTHLVEALARTDPDRARQVMRQHRGFYPDYGPDPWGTRLRALDTTLGPGAAEGGSDG
ncbi:MAG: hypothetical protein KDA21_04920 [Phycisphaerales bacterium]|nr:hypothetical protein [Phycisphaerales bacterium]